VAAARRAPFCRSRTSSLERVTHDVQRGGREIALSPKEYALLEFLMRHAGQPVSRAAIIEQVWKFDLGAMTGVVDVYIYLRRKVDFGYDRGLIRTVPRCRLSESKITTPVLGWLEVGRAIFIRFRGPKALKGQIGENAKLG